MKSKKLISLLCAASMTVSAFTGLGISASAAPGTAEFTLNGAAATATDPAVIGATYDETTKALKSVTVVEHLEPLTGATYAYPAAEAGVTYYLWDLKTMTPLSDSKVVAVIDSTKPYDRPVPAGATKVVDLLANQTTTNVTDGGITRSAIKVADLAKVTLDSSDNQKAGVEVLELGGDFLRGTVTLTLEYDFLVKDGESFALNLYKKRGDRSGPVIMASAENGVVTLSRKEGDNSTPIETSETLNAGEWYRVTQTTLPNGGESLGGIQFEVYSLTNGDVNERLASERISENKLSSDGGNVAINAVSGITATGDAMIDNFYAYSPELATATITVVDDVEGNPVEGAKVVLNDPRTGATGVTTGADGKAVFANLIKAPYTIAVTKSSWTDGEGTIDLAATTDATVEIHDRSADVQVRQIDFVYTADGTTALATKTLHSTDYDRVYFVGDTYTTVPNKYLAAVKVETAADSGVYNVYTVSGYEPTVLNSETENKVYINVQKLPGTYYDYEDFEAYGLNVDVRSEAGPASFGNTNNGSTVVAGAAAQGNVLKLRTSSATTWTAAAPITEPVEISYDMFFGYHTGTRTNVTTVTAEDGTEIVSYTYNVGDGDGAESITSVKIGGVEQLEAGEYLRAVGPKDNNNREYTTADPKPHVTITITPAGAVTVNFNRTISGNDDRSIDRTFTGTTTATDVNQWAHTTGVTVDARCSTVDNFAVKVVSDEPEEITGSVVISGATGLNGAPQVGDKLTAAANVTVGAEVTYQWYRDGVEIADATSAQYVVTEDDLGKVLKVVATAANEGFTGSVEAETAEVVAVPTSPVNVTKPDGVTVTVNGDANSSVAVALGAEVTVVVTVTDETKELDNVEFTGLDTTPTPQTSGNVTTYKFNMPTVARAVGITVTLKDKSAAPTATPATTPGSDTPLMAYETFDTNGDAPSTWKTQLSDGGTVTVADNRLTLWSGGTKNKTYAARLVENAPSKINIEFDFTSGNGTETNGGKKSQIYLLALKDSDTLDWSRFDTDQKGAALDDTAKYGLTDPNAIYHVVFEIDSAAKTAKMTATTTDGADEIKRDIPFKDGYNAATMGNVNSIMFRAPVSVTQYDTVDNFIIYDPTKTKPAAPARHTVTVADAIKDYVSTNALGIGVTEGTPVTVTKNVPEGGTLEITSPTLTFAEDSDTATLVMGADDVVITGTYTAPGGGTTPTSAPSATPATTPGGDTNPTEAPTSTPTSAPSATPATTPGGDTNPTEAPTATPTTAPTATPTAVPAPKAVKAEEASVEGYTFAENNGTIKLGGKVSYVAQNTTAATKGYWIGFIVTADEDNKITDVYFGEKKELTDGDWTKIEASNDSNDTPTKVGFYVNLGDTTPKNYAAVKCADGKTYAWEIDVTGATKVVPTVAAAPLGENKYPTETPGKGYADGYSVSVDDNNVITINATDLKPSAQKGEGAATTYYVGALITPPAGTKIAKYSFGTSKTDASEDPENNGDWMAFYVDVDNAKTFISIELDDGRTFDYTVNIEDVSKAGEISYAPAKLDKSAGDVTLTRSGSTVTASKAIPPHGKGGSDKAEDQGYWMGVTFTVPTGVTQIGYSTESMPDTADKNIADEKEDGDGENEISIFTDITAGTGTLVGSKYTKKLYVKFDTGKTYTITFEAAIAPKTSEGAEVEAMTADDEDIFGNDLDAYGTFEYAANKITGTAKKVTTDGFNTVESGETVGYYLPLCFVLPEGATDATTVSYVTDHEGSVKKTFTGDKLDEGHCLDVLFYLYDDTKTVTFTVDLDGKGLIYEATDYVIDISEIVRHVVVPTVAAAPIVDKSGSEVGDVVTDYGIKSNVDNVITLKGTNLKKHTGGNGEGYWAGITVSVSEGEITKAGAYFTAKRNAADVADYVPTGDDTKTSYNSYLDLSKKAKEARIWYVQVVVDDVLYTYQVNATEITLVAQDSAATTAVRTDGEWGKYGYTYADMTEGIQITEGAVTGTLKWVEPTGAAEGYYLPIRYTIDQAFVATATIDGEKINKDTFDGDDWYDIIWKITDATELTVSIDLDGDGDVYAPTTYTLDISAVEKALKGTVTIGGEAKVGETLKATADLKGGAEAKYQWYAGDAEISGANDATYVLTENEKGKAIKVVVTAEGFSGSVTSDPTAEVESNVPDPQMYKFVGTATINSQEGVKVPIFIWK